MNIFKAFSLGLAGMLGVFFVFAGIETLHLLDDDACEGPRGRFVLVAVDGHDEGLQVTQSGDDCSVEGITSITSGTALGQPVSMASSGVITTEGYGWTERSPLADSTAGRLVRASMISELLFILVAVSILGVAWREADAKESADA